MPQVSYRLSMPQPATHLVHVTVELQDSAGPTELRLPVWVPGSYMVREFARHVQSFMAMTSEGRPLAWSKTRKDTWTVTAADGEGLRVEFDVYAHDLTVRTSHVDLTHAFLNLGNLLPYVVGLKSGPLTVSVETPSNWTICCGLKPFGTGGGCFVAEDYDELIDSPIHAGSDPVLEFSVDDVPHRIAIWGQGNLDATRLTDELSRIVKAQAALFGGLPYDQYLFIVLLTDGARGGLEHRNSSAMMIPRFAFRAGRTNERALQLLSHEFFHTWNVKRIRPLWSHDSFDYASENYSRLLWAMEGITDYYASLMLRRAGIISPDRYLEILGDWMSDLAQTPGRRLQSVEESSFDAWIKYYRPDEHSANSSVSYYLKGALVSCLLDLEMRSRSSGTHSLDDVMQLLWQRHGLSGRGVPEDAYQAIIEEIAGGSWDRFFDDYVRGHEELDYTPALRAVGLEVNWNPPLDSPAVWLGVRLNGDTGRARISHVSSDGPAWGSGLSAGDELVALDGFRVDQKGLEDRLRDYRPGNAVRITHFRGDELVESTIILAAQPSNRATLRRSSHPNVQQRALYEAWLRAPW